MTKKHRQLPPARGLTRMLRSSGYRKAGPSGKVGKSVHCPARCAQQLYHEVGRSHGADGARASFTPLI